jgi:oligo-1,6-glucosidase
MDWWKSSVVYQIYPRSFQDSNEDGIGDLRGIIRRLDYLRELGIDLLWLGPVCRSPNRDMGYDVSDYTAIMDEFGTLDDFDELIAGAAARGIGVIVDLVLNHSSDAHPWFREALQGRESRTRDYYIWRDSADGPPNNWMSLFGGPAWTRDPVSGEYYLHLFGSSQPDLNWENPRVRQSLYSIMRFWLDRGVAGIRFDVISFISKRPGLPCAPAPEAIDWLAWYADGPRLHNYFQEMRREVLADYDIVTIGEAPGIPVSGSDAFVAADRGELDMLLLFDLMTIDRHPARFEDKVTWRPADLRELLRARDHAASAAGWNSNYLGNHDFPRMVSRFGDDGVYRVASAKMLATLLLTLRGTPIIYNGDEIGMTDIRYGHIDDYRDVLTLGIYRDLVSRGSGREEALERAAAISRDNARTPMQWTPAPMPDSPWPTGRGSASIRTMPRSMSRRQGQIRIRSIITIGG